MARSENNLHAVLADTATAIKAKKGDNTAIIPRDFADEITNLPSGGSVVIHEAPVLGINHFQSSTLVGPVNMYTATVSFDLSITVTSLSYVKNGVAYLLPVDAPLYISVEKGSITLIDNVMHWYVDNLFWEKPSSLKGIVYTIIDGISYIVCNNSYITSVTKKDISWTESSEKKNYEYYSASSKSDITIPLGETYDDYAITVYPISCTVSNNTISFGAASGFKIFSIQSN